MVVNEPLFALCLRCFELVFGMEVHLRIMKVDKSCTLELGYMDFPCWTAIIDVTG